MIYTDYDGEKIRLIKLVGKFTFWRKVQFKKIQFRSCHYVTLLAPLSLGLAITRINSHK